MPNTSAIFNEIETRAASRSATTATTTKTTKQTKTLTAEQCLVPSCLHFAPLPTPAPPHYRFTDPPALAHLIGLRFDMNDDLVRVVASSVPFETYCSLSCQRCLVALGNPSTSPPRSIHISHIFLVFFSILYFHYSDDGKFDLTSCSKQGQQFDLISGFIYSKSLYVYKVYIFIESVSAYCSVPLSLRLSACPMKHCSFR